MFCGVRASLGLRTLSILSITLARRVDYVLRLLTCLY